MDLETISAEAFGRSLTGLGVNLLSPDVGALVEFLTEVFGLTAHRVSEDFAIVRHGQMMMQLHADGTYGAHPLLGIVPETPPRGGGLQLYLFGIDPDAAIARAEARGDVVLEPVRDKPHGLREGTVLSPEGYAFSPAIPSG
ncbi:VOC family protein [Alterinioella nitratireducens]|uniref:VOC family protein n=1 Tax=Alterinioella nitratireducens TaxID=2735915 RepID=UPI0040590A91